MATHDYVINNQTTPAFRSDLNNALAAIASNNSSSSAPSTTFANMWWMDTTNNYLRIRDKNNANWIIVAEMDVTNSRVKLISDSLKAASAGGIDILDSSGNKIVDIIVASQSTAETGTNNTELMTPLRVKQSIAENAIGFPASINVYSTGTTSFAIPSGRQALLVRAAGGGGGGGTRGPGGGNNAYSGQAGGNTTVSNSTLGIAITAKGGGAGNGDGSYSGPFSTGDAGGDIITGLGGVGGAQDGNGDITGNDGRRGNLVSKYVTGTAVGGKTLTLSIGAGGASSGVDNAQAGAGGWVEIWTW
jgi:hypothetical protein